MMNNLIKIGLFVTLFVSTPIYASDWAVHGFAAQGVAKAKNSNFINSKGNTSLDLTDIGINVSYQYLPNLRFAGQAVYLNGGNRYEEGTRIDYMLADWTVFSDLNSQFNLYLGRYKNQHWLYSSTRDVPHTRPSIILPQSVYYDAFRDIALGSDGVALSYTRTQSNGELEFLWSYGRTSISKNASKLLISDFSKGKVSQDFVHQLTLNYSLGNGGLQFGLSLVDSDFKYEKNMNEPYFDAKAVLQRVMFNVLYNSHKWQFSSELFQERFDIDGFLSPESTQDRKGQGFYLQGRYFLDEKITLLARYDRFDNDKNDRKGNKFSKSTGGLIPPYFGYAYDTTIGLTYKINNNWQLQAEYHWIEGRARLSPAVVPDLVVNNDKNWNMWALQLMYWF